MLAGYRKINKKKSKGYRKKRGCSLSSIYKFIDLVNSHDDIFSKIIAKHKYNTEDNRLFINTKKSGAIKEAKNQPAAISVQNAEYTLNAEEEIITFLINQRLR